MNSSASKLKKPFTPNASFHVLVLLLVLTELASCRPGEPSGNVGSGALIDVSLPDALVPRADAGSRPDCRVVRCDPDIGLPDGRDPDGDLLDGRPSDSHDPDGYLLDSQPADGHEPNGDLLDSQLADGDEPDGNLLDSQLSDSQLSDSQLSDSQLSDSQLSDGHAADGDLFDGQPSDSVAAPVCGNGTCEAGESCSSCPGDCGACPPVCGNGTCEAGESCSSCLGDCGACPPVCGNGSCETGETCSNCTADCGACPPTVTHETEFITWNLYNNAGCISSDGVAKWHDRNDGPGALSIKATLLAQNPAIIALQEDGKLGPKSCSIGTVRDKVAGWLSSTHHVRSTDEVSGGWSGERFAIFIKKSKYQFITAGYKKCYYGGSEVRGFMWTEVDLISDATSNHFYVLNAHFKAAGTSADIAQRAAQAQCVIAWVKAKKVTNPKRAHFLLGDLNSGPDHNTKAYAMLTGSGGVFENTSTAGINAINTHGSHWIDHVLGTKNDFTKTNYKSWTVGAGQVTAGGKLSDHLGLRTRVGQLK